MAKQSKKTAAKATKAKKVVQVADAADTKATAEVMKALYGAGWTNPSIAAAIGCARQQIFALGKGKAASADMLANLVGVTKLDAPVKADAKKGEKAPEAKTGVARIEAAKKAPLIGTFLAQTKRDAKRAKQDKVLSEVAVDVNAKQSAKDLERLLEIAAEAAHKASGKKGRIIDVPSVVGSLKAPSAVAASPKAVTAPFVDERQLVLPLSMLLSNGALPPAMEASLRAVRADGAQVRLQLVSVTVPFESKA